MENPPLIHRVVVAARKAFAFCKRRRIRGLVFVALVLGVPEVAANTLNYLSNHNSPLLLQKVYPCPYKEWTVQLRPIFGSVMARQSIYGYGIGHYSTLDITGRTGRPYIWSYHEGWHFLWFSATRPISSQKAEAMEYKLTAAYQRTLEATSSK